MTIILSRLKENRRQLATLRARLGAAETAQQQLVVQAYRAGLLQREIAEAAGITQQRVSQILEAYDIRGKGGRWAQKRRIEQ